ncbi:Cysteine desulfurase (Nitrogenase metalloclusters biosynthesis protein nifS) [Bradyrhizobium sp. ORS 375]|uniref:cysteine desulfurase family protein n=1 Tax=Bradyrhizobium sp. (strain ORS 375) TaxID=566679 RepID=UPI00024079D2|nr:cysteine desulfurase family protein [Bradyrhizobium sp. ORS 375]CCD90854.1 Cysteine desulfurase (Nitrogenase metalloclusters biosynthesis protein nifS) [Bradyrhizobium sp. ORS 375]
MPDRVYLDWNATTPLRPEARAAMVAAFDLVGNPSSVHDEGRKARRVMEEARTVIARGLGTAARRVVFTSGGTEANTLALVPGLKAPAGGVERLLVSAIEHASVLAGGRFAPAAVQTIPVDRSGVVDVGRLEALLAAGPPALVSVMAANNETGVLQPVSQVAEIVHRAGGLLHVDAVQAFGKIPLDINQMAADLVTVSAHKIGGPKGAGALVLGGGVEDVVPVLRGGGQERGRRAGTENLAGIAGFGAAAGAALATLAADLPRLTALHERLEAGLRQTSGLTVFSAEAARLPNTTLFTAPGLKAETAVIGFDLEGIAVSSGSACSSGKVQPSHVLEAMGVGSAAAQGAVRLSLGWSTTTAEVDRAVEAWRKLSMTLLKGRDETALERF